MQTPDEVAATPRIPISAAPADQGNAPRAHRAPSLIAEAPAMAAGAGTRAGACRGRVGGGRRVCEGSGWLTPSPRRAIQWPHCSVCFQCGESWSPRGARRYRGRRLVAVSQPGASSAPAVLASSFSNSADAAAITMMIESDLRSLYLFLRQLDAATHTSG